MSKPKWRRNKRSKKIIIGKEKLLLRKQACRKCVFWEPMIENDIKDPKYIELIKCPFETPLSKPTDKECTRIEFAN